MNTTTKLRLLLLLLLLKSNAIFAQIDFTQVYHPIINDAEMAIIDSNYVDALDFYKGAFANVTKPFAKDIYNASLCAFYADKPALMFEYLEKLAEKGLPFDSLKKDTFYKLVIDTTAKWRKFEVQYRKIKPLINKELRDSLENMSKKLSVNWKKGLSMLPYLFYGKNTEKSIQLDKALERLRNNKEADFKIILEKNILDSLGKDSILFYRIKRNNARIDSLVKENEKIENKIQEENYKSILKIIDEYDFPDENVIGLISTTASYNFVFDALQGGIRYITTIVGKKIVFSKNLMVKEEFRLKDNKTNQEVIEIVFREVRNGKILPHVARDILNNQLHNEAYHSGNLTVFKIKLEDNVKCDESLFQNKKDKWLWKKEEFQENTPAQINEARAKIGLESLENAYKKRFYKQKMPFFDFGISSYSKEYSYVPNCEILEKLIKNSVVVDD